DYAYRCGLDVPPGLSAQLVLDGIRCAENDPDPSLYFGLAGLAWAGDVTDAWTTLGEDLAVDFDEQLASLLSNPFPRSAHTLFRGLSGLGLYALRRVRRTGPDPAAMIVQRLRECAVHDRDGMSWCTEPEIMRSPRGGTHWFNMGMAQGFLAVVCFLAFAAQAKIPGASEMLHESGRWLYAQRISERAGQCFPIGIDGTAKIPPQRLAWCNGDIPTALALLQAGIAADQRSWIDTATQVALLAASIPADDTLESSLCHGDTGIGFAFAFFHAITGAQVLSGASQRWFRRALGRKIVGAPYEGFRYLLEQPWGSPPSVAQRWVSSGGFLRGAGGVALALLAASESQPPEWAGALMLPWTPVRVDRVA
ncbi:MAG: lanthionine synthetase LanC family protein, partial [Nocardioidaceae bacterium]